MKLRKYNDADYLMIEHWWKLRMLPCPPKALLPTSGLVVEDESEDLCAMFVYETNSAIVWVGWPISNPKAPKEKTDAALDMALQYLKNACEYREKIVFTTSGHKGFVKRLLKHGFRVGDTDVSQYIYGGM